ncbi:hypothetical protein [Kangiella marina]|uniref:Tetratricopeptide repeat protein n=1 Tax=Kangiella marina TaxID=1079178 RepID=A0ABP8IJ01_9GAMM
MSQKERDLYQLIKGHFYYIEGKHNEAKTLLSDLAKSTNNSNIQARAYSIAAASAWTLGKAIDSFIYIKKANELLPKVNDNDYRVRILQNISSIYKDAELYEYALESSRQLKLEAEKTRKNTDRCVANYELASIERKVGFYDLALDRLLKSIKYCEKAKMTMFLLGIDDEIARIEGEQGNVASAIARLRNLIPKAEEYGWDMGAYIVYINLSKQLLKTESYEEAEAYALEGFNMSSYRKDKKRLQNASGILAEVYSALEENDKALKYFRIYRRLSNEREIKLRQRKLAFDTANTRGL